MIAQFYTFSKKGNSTKRPEGDGIKREVHMKSDTSIENPTLIISDIDLSVNYCYIPKLNRYYFINDIVMGNNKMFEISCVSDVLATFKDTISDYTGYVERSSHSYNNQINDNAVSVTQSIVGTRTASTSISWINAEVGCYGIRMIGQDGLIRTYTRVYLTDFANILNPDIVKSILEADIKELGALVFDASSYIVGAYWIPMAWADLPATEMRDIYIKYYNTGVKGLPISGFRQINDLVISKPAFYYTDFRAYNPMFTRYQLYLPAVGVIPLGSEYISKELKVDIRVDMQNGALFYCLKADGSVIGTYEGNLFTQIPLGNNSTDIKGAMSSAMSTIGGLMSKNIPLATTSAVDTVSNIIVPTPSISGNYQSAGMIKMHPDIELTAIFNGSGDRPTDVVGRPLCSMKRLGDIEGFIKCGSASVDIEGFASDKTAVNTHLNSGFFLE